MSQRLEYVSLSESMLTIWVYLVTHFSMLFRWNIGWFGFLIISIELMLVLKLFWQNLKPETEIPSIWTIWIVNKFSDKQPMHWCVFQMYKKRFHFNGIMINLYSFSCILYDFNQQFFFFSLYFFCLSAFRIEILFPILSWLSTGPSVQQRIEWISITEANNNAYVFINSNQKTFDNLKSD